MGKEPCSNCGRTSCNGIDCYYEDKPELSVEEECNRLRSELAEFKAWGREALQFINTMATRELFSLELYLPNSITVKKSQDWADKIIEQARRLGLEG